MNMGIIGAGIICEDHLRACEALPKIKVSCIADIDEEKAKRASSKCGASPYTDYREMIQKERPEAVIINLPHKLHEEAGVYCMENDCHVLLEKPMAVSVNACDNLIAAAKKNGRILLVGHITYFADQVIDKILAYGNCGRITMINAKRFETYFYEGRPKWFLQPEMSGGGMLFNVGAHSVARILHFGGSVKTVKAAAYKKYGTPVEGQVHAVFDMENGITCSLSLNGYSKINYQEFEIICENAIIKTSSGKHYVEVTRENGTEKIEFSGENPFVKQLSEFCACIESGSEHYLSGQYGRSVIDAAEKIYASAGIKYKI